MTMLSWALVLGMAGAARGELKPEEVAVIAMARSPESRQLAEYYAKARGIPESHIFLLPGRAGDSISRAAWEEEFRPAIRDWLAESGLKAKIRCLVTCWDVPLKIGGQDANSRAIVARKAHLADARESHVARFATVMQAIESLGRGSEPIDRPDYEPDVPLETLVKDFDEAAKALQKRLEGMESAAEKQQAAVVFERILTAGGGSTAVLGLVAKRGDLTGVPAEALLKIELAKGKLQGLQQGLASLASLPGSVARDTQILAVLQQIAGVLGSIRWIDEQRTLLKKNETHASFDSELSLLFWPDYPLDRWIQNVSHYAFDSLPGKRPTLMVSRLAAPSVELVRKLIDASIATEETGLTGKVYLDARGMAPPAEKAKRGGYAEYDQSLRDLAERLGKHTDLEVVLNNEGALFQPGDCPDAALYCGWYSLAKYVDAFDWRVGAVGYHIASSEAVKLREPGGKVWCNAMLEDGIAATLGPVAEPYLAAFPPPDDFFPLLLTGRYTLVETYYRTKPFNSWQMVLVADPLYNPFKNHPLLDESQLPDRMKPKEARPADSQPNTQPQP
ncbi:MAG: TIGR03790 family protein [Planctomycetota bacterium]